MNVGFWFTEDNYSNMCPTASGAIDGAGLTTALQCGGKLLLRPYFKGNPSPQQIASVITTIDSQIARYPHINKDNVYYQVGNEPNLEHEQWQGGLPAYVAFFRDVRALVPDRIKLAWAGISPGVDGWLAWYVAANLVRPDAIVAHVYGQTYESLVNLTLTIMRAVPVLPVIIGECNFGPGNNVIVDRDVWADGVWDRYLGWVRSQVRILFTLYFAYTWKADTGISTPVDAKGTRIAAVTLHRAIEDMRVGPPGRSWWVWYAAECGGVPGIIDACNKTGAKSVFIKGGDGPHAWSQATRQLVSGLAAGGLDVYIWHYFYGGWIAGNVHGDEWKWTVQDEIKAVQTMLNAAGPDVKGFIADVEGESEGRPDEANAYAMAVRRLLGAGKWFAYAPLPVIDYHQSLPYVQFNQVCDAVLPQFYARNIGGDPPWTLARLQEQWERWMAAWRASDQRVPILMPVGEAYGAATVESIRDFDRLAVQQEWPGWSYWSLQHALQEGLLAALMPTPEPNPAPTPEPGTGLVALDDGDRIQLQTLFESIYQAAEHINAVLAPYAGVGTRTGSWAEVGFKAVLSQTKEILGMNEPV